MRLYDPTRHETLRDDLAWDAARAAAAVERIVHDTDARFAPGSFWPVHPRDDDDHRGEPLYPLYFGAAGVIWALDYLSAVGAAPPVRHYGSHFDELRRANRTCLAAWGSTDVGSYLMGDTGILLVDFGCDPTADKAARLEALIAGNIDNPTRELMWGSPGTLLAALFLFERTGEPRWSDLFVATARKLWSQLEWSNEHGCRYWVQDMYGRRSTYLDAIHGFVATASPLIRGRELLDAGEWQAWETCMVQTVRSTAARADAFVNWPAWLDDAREGASPMLVQHCHGAPGFVTCLAALPSRALDDLLLAAGELTWAAGPLAKGANLCHGTAGNGYAFLKLHQRTGDNKWLDRARAFAMHAIAQSAADERRHGDLRHSLWTGDPGLALYLRSCIEVDARFPTLDVFFPASD